MENMDLAALEAALADLRLMLAKRENLPGYARNVEAIKARIAALEGQRDVLAEG